MQRYLMNFNTATMPERQTECLVVGSGVAGLTAAWHLAERGHKVLLAVRDTLRDSNTDKAQGGIAASFGPDDNPELHLQDTLIAGAGLSDEKISRIVVTEGPHDIENLIAHGAEFDRNPDGSLALGREGCHSRHRIVHAHGDATGAEVARALRAMVRQEPNITILEHCYIVDLLLADKRCYGATALLCQTNADSTTDAAASGQKIYIRADRTILATGGNGRLFQHTTNPEGATGSGSALAYRAGVELQDMEFVQFHPTALALKGCPNFLISEAVRGAGAILRNMAGERFMPRYHKMAELAPRDVVARAIFREMRAADSDHIFLDATVIDGVRDKFPMIAETCDSYGIAIAKQPIPIAPAAHYMMGGIKTDEWGHTNIPGLYACGEAACTGLQGANRLASNSLLEGLVLGRRCAVDIDERRLPLPTPERRQWSETSLTVRKGNADDIAAAIASSQRLMSKYLGISREKEDMLAGEAELDALAREWSGSEATTPMSLDLAARLITDQCIMKAALRRQESRGAHYRTDYPEPDPDWLRHCTDCLTDEATV